MDTKTTTAALAGAASAGSVGIFSDPLLMIWLAAGSIGGSVACVALWERAGGQGRLASVAAILGQFGTGLAFGFLLAPALIMLWKPDGPYPPEFVAAGSLILATGSWKAIRDGWPLLKAWATRRSKR